MDDIKIIDLFFARSELAIEALDGKYGATCHNLSRSILKDQQDAEECVNDAYLGVWNAIPPHRPNPLSVFVCKIVRNISIMRYRANTALKRNSNYDLTMEELENCLSSSVSVEDSLEEKVLIATVYKGNIIKNLIMDCQSYTKYRPNETTGGIFVSWRRKEELPTGA